VEIPCSSLNDNLIESEIFGHVRGAFTGAQTPNPGKLIQAHGGTIFLDEIGELSLKAQTRLLHFMQEGFFYRVGSNKREVVDVRIIAASNRDLLSMVKNGTFRQDLYYRLAVLRLTLPPLRERGEDVLNLAKYFLKKHQNGRQTPVFLSTFAKVQILNHFWPGNIRELQNVIKRAIVCADPDSEQIHHLEFDSIPTNGHEEKPQSSEASPFFLRLPRLPIEEIKEFQKIRAALIQTQGCLSKAAEQLGLSRFALYRRLKKFGLSKNTALAQNAQKWDDWIGRAAANEFI
jgi:transcriptional regulator with PAS, ATPase and Fis domain